MSARNVRREAPSAPPSIAPVAAEVAPKPRPRREPSKLFAVARAVFGVLMVVGIGSGVAWGARRYVRTSPRFAVTEIRTTGGKRHPADEIAALAGVAEGQNVFTIDLDKARQRLAADPWIETAEISRQLPSTLVIRVTERAAGGIVAMPEGTYLVTRDGAMIKRVEAGDPLDFHVVTGVPLKAVVDDREGATRQIRAALDLAYDYEHSPLAQRSPVSEVHVEPSGELTLIVGKTGITLRMGAAPYRRKLEQAARTMGELDRRGAKAEVIILDDEARPERVVVRMR